MKHTILIIFLASLISSCSQDVKPNDGTVSMVKVLSEQESFDKVRVAVSGYAKFDKEELFHIYLTKEHAEINSLPDSIYVMLPNSNKNSVRQNCNEVFVTVVGTIYVNLNPTIISIDTEAIINLTKSELENDNNGAYCFDQKDLSSAL